MPKIGQIVLGIAQAVDLVHCAASATSQLCDGREEGERDLLHTELELIDEPVAASPARDPQPF